MVAEIKFADGFSLVYNFPGQLLNARFILSALPVQIKALKLYVVMAIKLGGSFPTRVGNPCPMVLLPM